ncbi:MAG: type VI secretion system protein TssA [Marinomonas atlantica]|nr:type VI secretion system protein TssA [Marinomonas atlantica]
MSYRDQILLPISQDNPVGEKLLEDTLLDFIESQIMKVGSLSHAEVQWDEIEKSTVKLLETKTKDLKLLTYLLQCLQHKTTPERFSLSIQILTDFMGAYWQTCYPAPGDRGLLPRRKFFSQIASRSMQAAEKLDVAMFNSELKEELDKAVAALKTASETLSLPLDHIEAMEASLKRKFAFLTEKKAATQADKAKNEGSSQAQGESAAKIEIDGSSDRAVKQTLLKVSDFLSELDDSDALVLRLRRFAVWQSIKALPEVDSKGQTQLMPVAPDRIREYEEQLQRGADLALWRKVEQSLTVSPFWFDGHYLSYRIASKLNKEEGAQAIQSELLNFVKRLPKLLDCSFKSGIPFAGEDTKKWLSSVEEQASNQSAMSVGWDDKRKEAFSLAKEGGLSVALGMLNEGLKQSKEPRDSFYWRMLSADTLKQNKLAAMAVEQYETLLTQVQDMSVSDWEPSLVQRLERVVKQG